MNDFTKEELKLILHYHPHGNDGLCEKVRAMIDNYGRETVKVRGVDRYVDEFDVIKEWLSKTKIVIFAGIKKN